MAWIPLRDAASKANSMDAYWLRAEDDSRQLRALRLEAEATHSTWGES